jgi:hypothetical protein
MGTNSILPLIENNPLTISRITISHAYQLSPIRKLIFIVPCPKHKAHNGIIAGKATNGSSNKMFFFNLIEYRGKHYTF